MYPRDLYPGKYSEDGGKAESRGTFDPKASAGLFVGVSSFEDERFSEVPFAVDDAVDLAHLFTLELGLILPEHTVLLLAGKPRKPESLERLAALLERGALRGAARMRDVYRYLGELTRRTEKSGLFVLTVATHGVSDQGGDFLVAADSLKARALRTGVAVAELFDEVSAAGAGRRLVLLDACRERLSRGTRSVTGSAMAQSFADAIASVRGSVVLSAATLGGFAYDDRSRKNGVFTAAVLDGLRGAAEADSDGWITVRTLADFVQRRVATWVSTNRPDHSAKSLGIAKHIEATAESLPLAPHPEAMRKRQDYRIRREAALARFKDNPEKALSGELWDQLVALLPEDKPSPEAERRLLEIEAIDNVEDLTSLMQKTAESSSETGKLGRALKYRRNILYSIYLTLALAATLLTLKDKAQTLIDDHRFSLSSRRSSNTSERNLRELIALKKFANRQQVGSRLFIGIGNNLPASLWLDRLSLNNDYISIEGRAYNTAAIANLIDVLRKLEGFSGPALTGVTKRGDITTFVIALGVTEEPPLQAMTDSLEREHDRLMHRLGTNESASENLQRIRTLAEKSGLDLKSFTSGGSFGVGDRIETLFLSLQTRETSSYNIAMFLNLLASFPQTVALNNMNVRYEGQGIFADFGIEVPLLKAGVKLPRVAEKPASQVDRREPQIAPFPRDPLRSLSEPSTSQGNTPHR